MAMESDFDFSAHILFMEIREYLPTIDPENLLKKDVLKFYST